MRSVAAAVLVLLGALPAAGRAPAARPGQDMAFLGTEAQAHNPAALAAALKERTAVSGKGHSSLLSLDSTVRFKKEGNSLVATVGASLQPKGEAASQAYSTLVEDALPPSASVDHTIA